MKVELHANQGHRWARGCWGVGRSGRYANERPSIDGQGDAGLHGGALLIMPTLGGGYANERPCIDGHGGSRGGGEHNFRAG